MTGSLAFRRRLLLAALCPGWLRLLVGVEGKWVHGSVTLGKHQAKVVTKFCFDFSRTCTETHCKDGYPGHLNMTVFNAGRTDGTPEVHFALLDDEYYSFPEVSQVWNELGCKDVLKASKKTHKLDWKMAQTPAGTNFSVNVIEKVRPRWWYITIASCSDHDVSLSYSMHMLNTNAGTYNEFSFDAMGMTRLTLVLCVVFAGLTALQLTSINSWKMATRTASWQQVHAVLLLVLAASSLAAFGQACWLKYFWHFGAFGDGGDLWAMLGRGGVIAGRVFLSLVLLLLSSGECVCSPHITWAANKDVIRGLVVFGVLCFMLELYGESEFRSTVTEYIYDTRPGMALIAFDILWLWLYASRAWRTFRAETRLKARRFFRIYSGPFGFWFASLPAVAGLAHALDPWVRHYWTCALNGGVHAAALGALVYTFQPRVAMELYELKAMEYNKLSQEESSNMFDEMDEDI